MLFHPCPQPLLGIEFWGVSGQTVQPPACVVFGQRRPGHLGAMGVQPVPEQEDCARNPAQQVADEGDDLRAGDGAPQQTEIGVRVGGDGRDGRQLGPVEAVVEKRRLAARGPRFAGGGQERETALIEEDQWGLQGLGFFSSVARWTEPNAGWPPRRVRGGPASANSSRSGAAGGRHGHGQNAPGSDARSDRRCAGRSRLATRIRRLRLPARADAAAGASVGGPAWAVVRGVGGGASLPRRAVATARPRQTPLGGSRRVAGQLQRANRRATGALASRRGRTEWPAICRPYPRKRACQPIYAEVFRNNRTADWGSFGTRIPFMGCITFSGRNRSRNEHDLQRRRHRSIRAVRKYTELGGTGLGSGHRSLLLDDYEVPRLEGDGL